MERKRPTTNQTGKFGKLWNSSDAFKFQVKLTLWTSPNKPSNTITNGEQRIKRKTSQNRSTTSRSPIMEDIINNQDLHGHISSAHRAIRMGSIDKLARLFRNRYGTFSDAEGENIIIFAKNADNFMTQNMIPSLEMGAIVTQNLRKEPYTRAKRWRDTMTVDPEKINADHWREQPYQAATPFLPYQPMQMAQNMIPARPAGIDIHGNPDPNDPGHPGQPQLPFIGMRPPVPAVREQVAVDMNYCLKAYLLHAFQKKVDITAAEKFLTTFKTQHPRQTCSNFIDVFMVRFEHYITRRWTIDEREAPNFRETVNTVRLQYIREGLCREFKKHLDSNPQIVTLQQVDDEIQRWARETIEGQEFTRNCNAPRANHPLTAEQFDNRATQEEDSPDSTESYSPTSTRQKPRDTTTRGRGSGARGGRTSNNNIRSTFTDHRQPKLPKMPQDNDDQPSSGRSQLLASTLKMIGETFTKIGTWITQKPTSGHQQIQWSTEQPNVPTPVTLTVTNPEDAKWMAQMRNSGSDPATVITACRQNQQHLNQSQPINNYISQCNETSANFESVDRHGGAKKLQIPPTLIPQSSHSNDGVPPSGHWACNEYSHIATGLPTAERHQKGAHHKPPDEPDNNNYHSYVLPSGIVVCIECQYLTTSFEAADRHQKEKHPRPDDHHQTTHVQPTRISSSLLPSGHVACNDCGYIASTFELADEHQQEAHPRLANGPEDHE